MARAYAREISLLLHRGHADNGVRLDDLRVERKAEPVGIDVEYTGPKLAPATHYDWYVDVQTKRGWVSARSAPAPRRTSSSSRPRWPPPTACA